MNQRELDEALLVAARRNLREVPSLLARGARSSADTRSEGGQDALMSAIAVGASEEASAIWLSGADASAADERGRTSFWWAAKKGLADVARLLAPASDVNKRDASGATPLIICLANANDEDDDGLACLDFLLEVCDFELSASSAPSETPGLRCMGSMEIVEQMEASHGSAEAARRMRIAFAKSMAMSEAKCLREQIPLGGQDAVAKPWAKAL